MEYHWYDFVGNIGVSLILIAYFLLQISILNSKSVRFSLLNIIGALLILLRHISCIKIIPVLISGHENRDYMSWY